MLKKHLKDFAILVDFDGTITTFDTNVHLTKIHGNPRVEEFWQAHRKGKMDFLTTVNSQFGEIKITEEEYMDFILTEIELTEGFKEFYNNIEKNNIPFAIVSGGFSNGIIPFLKKHGIENVDIFSNSFIFNDDNISVKFHDEKGVKEDIDHCFGPCGNCKIKHYNRYKEKYENVLFIGDGFTDQCVSQIADVIFAKGSLLDYCKENQIDCIPWEDFNYINELIFSL